jgi:hypothetical protein
MFEKEAEEYSKKLFNPSLEYAFKDGAEFGYNKALEGTETMLKVLKDRGVISSWYYNGSYHVGNELPR